MPEPKIKRRFITCFQSSGRIGKSTMLEGILAWASFAGVPVAIVDCDGEHLTLSKRFPEAAFVNATRSKDEFLQLMTSMPESPISVADFPAQATEFLLDSMQSLRVLDALEGNGTRMTVLMFAADDPTATASMAKTYRALGNRVDYVVVKNPARFRSRLFDESSLADLFRQTKVPVIELPAITATTIQQINAASAERKRHITFAEAVKIQSLHALCRFEIEHFLNRIYVQCEDAAEILVPDTKLIQNGVVHLADRIVAKPVDEFSPLNIHE